MINLHRKYVIITNQWGGFVKKKKKIVISSKIIIIIMAVCLFISLVINIYLFSIKKAVNMLDENIVFFGDSITEVYKVDEFFPKRNVINSGISGDRTENLLERMDDVYRYNPSKVFLLIGVNDLNREKSIDEITKNIQKIINNIKANRKYTKIYIESVYPINRNIFEEKDYDDDSYFCLMAVRSSDADDAVYKRIVELFQSETTKQIFQDEFNGYFVPAWEVQK